jgi:hypothetical protein
MGAARFKAEHAGDSWLTPVDCRELAKLCEGAGLSCIQAEVVRLTTAKHDPASIALFLDLSEERAQGVAAQAEWRIRRSQSWIHRALRHELKLVLECLRNTFNPCPRTAVFRKIAGGYDTDPVRFRSRLHGEAPEDLIDEEGYVLRSLPRLLVGRRMEQPQA